MMYLKFLVAVISLLRPDMVTARYCDKVVVSTCPDDVIEPWNTKNVAKNLKLWFESLEFDHDAIPSLDGSALYINYGKPVKMDIPSYNENEDLMPISIARVDCDTGHASGLAWLVPKLYSGEPFQDGFLYGNLDSRRTFSGENVTWIYPDMKTVLTGKFEKAKMLAGKESKIVAERCNMGIKEIKLADAKSVKNTRIYKHQKPTPWKICDGETLIDPYERKTIYVGDSVYVEEGVFAKRNIAKNEIVAYYIGMIYPSDTYTNLTSEGDIEHHKNLMTYAPDKDYVVNILKPHWNITTFRATLAHKINHSFKAQTYFWHAYHPRFGFTVTAVAEKAIKKGEEVFVDYSYPSSGEVPQWYAELYKEQEGKVWKGKTF